MQARIELETQQENDPSSQNNNDFIGNILGIIGSHIEQFLAEFDAIMTGGNQNKGDTRMMYPRQPTHAVQVSLSGLSARDVACHFVQVFYLNSSCSFKLYTYATFNMFIALEFQSYCERRNGYSSTP